MKPKRIIGFALMSKAKHLRISSKAGKVPHKKPRGFALMSRERLKAISKRGGQTIGRPKGLAALSPERRLEIVRMGGLASKKRRKDFSK